MQECLHYCDKVPLSICVEESLLPKSIGGIKKAVFLCLKKPSDSVTDNLAFVLSVDTLTFEIITKEKHFMDMLAEFAEGCEPLPPTPKHENISVKCPKCKSQNIIPVIYGLPSSMELIESAERGEVQLGGCCIDEDAPDYHCKRCKYEWRVNNSRKW